MDKGNNNKKSPVAIQLYSVRDYAEKDLENTLKSLKEMGYDGVELCGLYDKTPEELKSLLDEIGLVPISAHVGIDLLRKDFDKTISDYKKVGCDHIVVPWLPQEEHPNTELFETVVTDLEFFGKKLKDCEMTLSYHNHSFDLNDHKGMSGLDYLYSKVSGEFLKAEIDICWIAAKGKSPIEYIEKYKNRIPLLHLKDYIGVWEQPDFSFRPVGYGVQNIKNICKTALECGTQWFIVEQDQPSMDKNSLECAELSINYLKNLDY